MKLHNEELHDLYCSPSIIRTIISRIMMCAGHVERIRDKRDTCRLLAGKPEGKRPYEYQDVGGRVILQWISQRQDGMLWTGLVWLRTGTGGELL
jgi:hypothetical protein